MTLDDVKSYRMQESIKLVERLLPLREWEFKQSATFFGSNIHPTVIYDSASCRIRAIYEATSRYHEHMMILHYGKLEVPNDAQVLLGQAQEKDYPLLWHSVRLPLYFLGGLSPQEAKNAKHPRLIKEFEQSALAKDVKYEPEKDLRLHATIWKIYGRRLFEIFDVGSKDLWERYSTFVSEYMKTLPQV